MPLRVCPYFCSQYCWFIIICLLLFFVIPFSHSLRSNDFFSKLTHSDFNETEYPVWFLHTAGLRLNTNNFETVSNRFKQALTRIQPELVFISGDLADNKDGKEHVDADTALYLKLLLEIKDYPTSKILTVPGPHDIFALRNPPQHFQDPITTTRYTHQQLHYSAIQLNPYNFPTPPKELMRWVIPTDQTRESIFEQLYRTDIPFAIAVAATPAYMWYPPIATNSETMSDALLSSNYVRFYLSGQLDIDEPFFMHHADALEVVGVPLYKHNKVGLVTVDNQRSGYHSIDLSKEHIVVLTSPAPVHQTSGIDVIDGPTFCIRAIAFTDKLLHLHVRTSFVEATLRRVKELAPGIFLYQYPTSVGNGKYVMELSGDWSGSVDFQIGQTIAGFKELSYCNDSTLAWSFIFVVFFIVSFLIVLPFPVTGVMPNFDKWMDYTSKDSHWWYATILGFLAVKHRFMKFPKFLRIPLFFSIIWTLCLPISFFAIEGKVAMFWAWGYVLGSDVKYHFIGMQFTTLYLCFVVLPICLMASAVEGTKIQNFIFIFDAIFYLSSFGGIVWVVTELVKICGSQFALWSPLFVLIPIYLHISLWLAIFKFRRIETDKSIELVTSLYQP